MLGQVVLKRQDFHCQILLHYQVFGGHLVRAFLILMRDQSHQDILMSTRKQVMVELETSDSLGSWFIAPPTCLLHSCVPCTHTLGAWFLLSPQILEKGKLSLGYMFPKLSNTVSK